MKFCESKGLIDRQSYVAQYVSLALLVIGTGSMLGTDDLLAAFCCGTAFAWDGFFNRQTEEAVFGSVIDLLFNVACFVYIGAWTPFDDFDDPVLTITVWRLIVISILILLLRRLPIMVALYKWIPDVQTFREAVFSGHFGPMGVGAFISVGRSSSRFAYEAILGAIFISTLAVHKLPVPEGEPQTQAELLAKSIQPIISFVVLCSILVHGLSIPFFSLGRRVRTVSRTWSRHGGAPDWTTLTRRVSKAEDIVINRDPRDVHDQMERGDVTPAVTIHEKEDITMVTEKPVRDEDEASGSTPTTGNMVDDGEEVEPATTEHDGSLILAEWREGPHQVIERRIGPGEEVPLFLHRDAPADTDEFLSNAGRGRGPPKRLRSRKCRACDLPVCRRRV